MLNTRLHAESTHTDRLYLVDFTPQWLQLPHYCIIIIIITEKEQPRKRPDKLQMSLQIITCSDKTLSQNY